MSETKIKKIKPFPYKGGKHYMSKYILEIVDLYKYDYYIEPYVGSGTIFFYNACEGYNKKTVVILNDINSTITNFYKVLRDNPEELLHKIKYTPFSREEFEEAVDNLHNNNVSDLERARVFYYIIHTKMMQSDLENISHHNFATIRNNHRVTDLYNKLDKLNIFNKFLQNTLIENKDGIELLEYWLKRIEDKTTFIYLDPIYLYSDYKVTNDTYHVKLLELLNKYKDKSNIHIMISSYNSELYKLILKDWHIKKIDAAVGSSSFVKDKVQKRATECIWSNIAAGEFLR